MEEEGPYASLSYSRGPVHGLAYKSALLRDLAESVRESLNRAEIIGAKPPSHVTLEAEEYDDLWLECGKPDRMTVWGVEVRRMP